LALLGQFAQSVILVTQAQIAPSVTTDSTWIR
jgi:hypothetical protein